MELVKQIAKIVIICEILKFAVAFIYYPIAPVFTIAEIVCVAKACWEYFKNRKNDTYNGQ